jgi:hypothetical protein
LPAVCRFAIVKQIGLIAGILLVLAFASQMQWGRVLAGQNDFLAFYGGAKLVGTGELHSDQAMERVHRGVAGVWLPGVLYIRPDFYAVLLKPLGWLPYSLAYFSFQALNLAAFLGFVWIHRARRGLLWLLPISIPLVANFVNAQDVPLVLFAVSIALWADSRGYSFAAGLLLALCSIKAHFLVFLPVALILQRRWGILMGGLSGGVLLYLVGASLEGWRWLLRYPSILSRPEIHPDPFQFMNLRGIAKAAELDSSGLLVLTLIGSILVIACLWRARHQSFHHLVAVSLLGGLLISFHLGIHDCLLLMLVYALAPEDSPLAHGAMILSYPIFYFILMMDGWPGAAPAILLVLFLVQHLRTINSSQFSAIASRIPALERYGP